jgi:hypothetical protein
MEVDTELDYVLVGIAVGTDMENPPVTGPPGASSLRRLILLYRALQLFCQFTCKLGNSLNKGSVGEVMYRLDACIDSSRILCSMH